MNKERVVAISHIKDGVTYIFGYGYYIGKEVPDENVPGFGQIFRYAQITNPCIVLDNGKKVYGCECWWKKIKENETLENTVLIDIDEARKDLENLWSKGEKNENKV